MDASMQSSNEPWKPKCSVWCSFRGMRLTGDFNRSWNSCPRFRRLKSPTPMPKAIMPPSDLATSSTSRTPLTASSLSSMRPPVPPMPTRSSGPILESEPGDPTPGDRGVCAHRNTTRRGSNQYLTMVTCKDCGQRLQIERREPDADRPMTAFTPMECPHPTDQVSWRGSNGYAWKWSCAACGASDSVKKQPGQPRPTWTRIYVSGHWGWREHRLQHQQRGTGPDGWDPFCQFGRMGAISWTAWTHGEQSHHLAWSHHTGRVLACGQRHLAVLQDSWIDLHSGYDIDASGKGITRSKIYDKCGKIYIERWNFEDWSRRNRWIQHDHLRTLQGLHFHRCLRDGRWVRAVCTGWACKGICLLHQHAEVSGLLHAATGIRRHLSGLHGGRWVRSERTGRWRCADVLGQWLQLHMPRPVLDGEVWGCHQLSATMDVPRAQEPDRNWRSCLELGHQETLHRPGNFGRIQCPRHHHFDWDRGISCPSSTFTSSSTRPRHGDRLGGRHCEVSDLGMHLQRSSRTSQQIDRTSFDPWWLHGRRCHDPSESHSRGWWWRPRRSRSMEEACKDPCDSWGEEAADEEEAPPRTSMMCPKRKPTGVSSWKCRSTELWDLQWPGGLDRGWRLSSSTTTTTRDGGWWVRLCGGGRDGWWRRWCHHHRGQPRECRVQRGRESGASRWVDSGHHQWARGAARRGLRRIPGRALFTWRWRRRWIAVEPYVSATPWGGRGRLLGAEGWPGDSTPLHTQEAVLQPEGRWAVPSHRSEPSQFNQMDFYGIPGQGGERHWDRWVEGKAINWRTRSGVGWNYGIPCHPNRWGVEDPEDVLGRWA